jgi:lipoprotein signal peptidase
LDEEMKLLQPFLELLKLKNEGVAYKIQHSNDNVFEKLALVNLIFIILYFIIFYIIYIL